MDIHSQRSLLSFVLKPLYLLSFRILSGSRLRETISRDQVLQVPLSVYVSLTPACLFLFEGYGSAGEVLICPVRHLKTSSHQFLENVKF